jgi:hypothetical protein
MNELRVQTIGGIRKIEENQSTWKKICPSVTSTTINPM